MPFHGRSRQRPLIPLIVASPPESATRQQSIFGKAMGLVSTACTKLGTSLGIMGRSKSLPPRPRFLDARDLLKVELQEQAAPLPVQETKLLEPRKASVPTRDSTSLEPPIKSKKVVRFEKYHKLEIQILNEMTLQKDVNPFARYSVPFSLYSSLENQQETRKMPLNARRNPPLPIRGQSLHEPRGFNGLNQLNRFDRPKMPMRRYVTEDDYIMTESHQEDGIPPIGRQIQEPAIPTGKPDPKEEVELEEELKEEIKDEEKEQQQQQQSHSYSFARPLFSQNIEDGKPQENVNKNGQTGIQIPSFMRFAPKPAEQPKETPQKKNLFSIALNTHSGKKEDEPPAYTFPKNDQIQPPPESKPLIMNIFAKPKTEIVETIEKPSQQEEQPSELVTADAPKIQKLPSPQPAPAPEKKFKFFGSFVKETKDEIPIDDDNDFADNADDQANGNQEGGVNDETVQKDLGQSKNENKPYDDWTFKPPTTNIFETKPAQKPFSQIFSKKLPGSSVFGKQTEKAEDKVKQTEKPEEKEKPKSSLFAGFAPKLNQNKSEQSSGAAAGIFSKAINKTDDKNKSSIFGAGLGKTFPFGGEKKTGDLDAEKKGEGNEAAKPKGMLFGSKPSGGLFGGGAAPKKEGKSLFPNMATGGLFGSKKPEGGVIMFGQKKK